MTLSSYCHNVFVFLVFSLPGPHAQSILAYEGNREESLSGNFLVSIILGYSDEVN
jgi:hypothetical protein